ncbi:hypothetical protein J0A67_01465 [Algoriphagus aestuariicola]|uniref:Uncharacterized protein n=1 Tax=Algoriphagus aestuariicola TaxID=1852016 RepID=A0ABS3BKD7_9BACT|nr:hypothetical protein [Algoriphagus aestuariicola]MBN7799505.1 hypothetical protein [Algoriphagus aestuariicola]
MNKKDQFLKYSKNLELVLSSFNKPVRLVNKHTEGNYICPIGFTNHSIEGLNETYSDQLSIEHAPPRSLGGKAICLVRKDLNNKSGHENDKALIRYIETTQFKRGESTIMTRMNLNLPRLKSPKAKFHIDSENRLNFIFNNITLKDHIGESDLKNDYQFKFEFKLQEINQAIKNILLKIAYLHAFKSIGYILCFGPKEIYNKNYKKVREQILNSDKEIIPIVFEISRVKKFDGVAIITDPKEFASIIVSYPLTLNGITDYVSVMLPAPDSRGFSALELIKKQGNLDFKFQTLPQIEIWKNKESAIYFYNFWKHYNGIV